jgi:MFS family permease
VELDQRMGGFIEKLWSFTFNAPSPAMSGTAVRAGEADPNPFRGNPTLGAPRAFGALILFMLIHTILSVDRSIPSIVLEPIKREYGVLDSQLGLLPLGFAIFFGVCGVPLGRWVDRGVRRNVLALCVAIFSLMTGAAGLTTSFAQLLGTRLLVGAGEAGGMPAMLSMISDLFPAKRRASVISIFYLGVPLGFILTFLVGGQLAGAIGWRSVFYAAAAPGLLLSLLIFVILREPTRGAVQGGAGVSHSWTASLRFILTQPALRHLLATTVIISALSAAVMSWAVSFLIRSHHLSLPQAGLFMAVAYGGMSAVGTLGGGWLADALARSDVRWRAWSCAIATLLACPGLACFLLAPSILTAGLALCLWSLASGFIYGPVLGLTQSLTPPNMRGMSTGLYYVLSHFAGVGSGPLLVGVFSDLLRPSYGVDSLRYGMLALSVLYVWAAVHFILVGRTLKADLARASQTGVVIA